MNRTVVALLVPFAVLAGVVAGAPAAQADEAVVSPRLESRTVCVLPDFPVTGSGWKVQSAVAAWNDAQALMTLTTTRVAGCAEVGVHRYFSTTDGMCAYTLWDNVWAARVPAADGSWLVPGADIYLNDACVTVGIRFARRTIIHELGHAFGLPHSSSPGSVMNTEMLWPIPHDVIEDVDVVALAALYRNL